VESRDRCEGGVCAKEGKGVSIVKRRKGRGERICEGTVVEGLYLAVEVTANGAGVLCREEGWEEENGARLQCYESMLEGLSKEATLVLSNTRELDRVPSTE